MFFRFIKLSGILYLLRINSVGGWKGGGGGQCGNQLIVIDHKRVLFYLRWLNRLKGDQTLCLNMVNKERCIACDCNHEEKNIC